MNASISVKKETQTRMLKMRVNMDLRTYDELVNLLIQHAKLPETKGAV